MKLKNNILLLCYFPIAIFSIANLIFGLHFENILGLNPQKIASNGEFWRILTFPFVDLSFVSIGLMFLSFFLFSKQLDKYFAKFLLVLLFALSILLEGTTATLIYWGKDINITGMSSILAFVLVLTAGLFPKIQLNIKNKFLPNNLQVVLIFFLLLISSGFLYLSNDNINQATSYYFPIIFGSITGFIIYLQIYLFKRFYLPKRNLKSLDEIGQILAQARESMQKLETSLVEKPNYSHYKNPYETRYNNITLSDDHEENESILNKLLDKILIEGKDSLTPYEKKLLKELSRKI